ncbi:uncharacterized protein LOC131671757 [Phymastichus coffea]|uniref:uncharacterized protein LOC131671757 n=1 Tax=Phymastichus coffea TaxID=108790 RepID=UPI00273C8A9A|nr:uncharacterized protein LOC131671757 [Phymastichus coffea]
MDNNVSLSRVHVTSENALIFRIFHENDTGIYRCLGKNETQEKGLHNYRIELTVKSNNSDVKGDLAAYEHFKKTNLDPLNKKFAESDIDEFVGIREAGISLEVVTEWGVWGPCKECVKMRGVKKKRGHCRLKCYYNESTTGDSEILQMFKNNPTIPCKSRFLQELFPSVSNATGHLSEFVLTEKCKPCKKEKNKKRRKFKYKKRYLLAQGGHLTLSCPNTTILSDIIWMRDSKVLPRGKGRSVRKKDSTPRIYVDHYNTIYLKDVSDPEQGKYTCTVDDKRILQVTVVVVPKRGLLFEAFVTHLRILGFIFLLTTALYCAGVIKACKHRDQFKIKTYEQLKEERQIFSKA